MSVLVGPKAVKLIAAATQSGCRVVSEPAWVEIWNDTTGIGVAIYPHASGERAHRLDVPLASTTNMTLDMCAQVLDVEL